MNKEEIWKDIKDFEGFYQVSNMGQVRSVDREYWNRSGSLVHRKGMLLAISYSREGYPVVQLSKDGKKYYSKVHRLVAEAFIPNPNNLPAVNHKNEIKHDNRVENLEWITIEDNSRYGTSKQRMVETKRRKKGL